VVAPLLFVVELTAADGLRLRCSGVRVVHEHRGSNGRARCCVCAGSSPTGGGRAAGGLSCGPELGPVNTERCVIATASGRNVATVHQCDAQRDTLRRCTLSRVVGLWVNATALR
jgi:hypothetical protein